MSIIIVLTLIWMYYDATTHKIDGAGAWLVGTLLLWIIGFPAYLIKRKSLIESAAEHPTEAKHPVIVYSALTLLLVIALAVKVTSDSQREAALATIGSSRAQYNLGVRFISGKDRPKDFTKGLIWMRKAANNGLREGQYVMGLAYMQGEGIDPDVIQAADWFRKAANQGFAPAQVKLGELYLSGRGVPQDNVQAIAWLQKAADQRDGEGEFMLGVAYESGTGVAQNSVKAMDWFRAATHDGYLLADKRLRALSSTQ